MRECFQTDSSFIHQPIGCIKVVPLLTQKSEKIGLGFYIEGGGGVIALLGSQKLRRPKKTEKLRRVKTEK